jgi:hypothetical protein
VFRQELMHHLLHYHALEVGRLVGRSVLHYHALEVGRLVGRSVLHYHALEVGRLVGRSERSLLHLSTSCTAPLSALSDPSPCISSQADEAKAQFAHVDGDHLSLLNVYHAYKQVSTEPFVLSVVASPSHICCIQALNSSIVFVQMIDFFLCACVCVWSR